MKGDYVAMAEKTNILLHSHVMKLEEELENLKVVRRKEVSQKIKEAREQGDLSENAEYDAAKDEQKEIEARIEEIENILKNAEVVDEDEVDTKKVNIGCTLKVVEKTTKKEMTFTIVGSAQADSLKGNISNESPLGKVLIGKKLNETVKFEAPNGTTYSYKITDIKKMSE